MYIEIHITCCAFVSETDVNPTDICVAIMLNLLLYDEIKHHVTRRVFNFFLFFFLF